MSFTTRHSAFIKTIRCPLALLVAAALITGCPPDPEDDFDPGPVVPGEMVPVPGGVFEMGRPYPEPGWVDEIPVHSVYLDAYSIGKYPVTNKEYADVLNWAHEREYLTGRDGNRYAGDTTVYAHGQPLASIFIQRHPAVPWPQIEYGAGVFRSRGRDAEGGRGIPMLDHPVVHVSWYGAVAYANWRSVMDGLEPCYDFDTWERYEPVRNGYRLPTEAEWERAAAWQVTEEGGYHWRYGFTSDFAGIRRANYFDDTRGHANPQGLNLEPFTSPVGWYNGLNRVRWDEPGTRTRLSRSPVGAYDMSGNVWEWCHDRYNRDQYAANAARGIANNPVGPGTGETRVLRGGAWDEREHQLRTAGRLQYEPGGLRWFFGFRLCRAAQAD